MKLPAIRGQGKLPRYGGGWMHQFGHVYLLQQEFLQKPEVIGNGKTSSDWFRAMELWHVGRQEGIAMNIAHYTNLLRHCAAPDSGAPWCAALDVLRQMRREALRADCTAVSLALQCCAQDGRWQEALSTFSFFANMPDSTVAAANERNMVGKYSGVGLKMDSLCVSAVLRACVGAGQQEQALSFVKEAAAERRDGGVGSVDSFTVEAALNDLALVNDVPASVVEDAIDLLFSDDGDSPQVALIEESKTSSLADNDQEDVVHVSGSSKKKPQLSLSSSSLAEEADPRYLEFFEGLLSRRQ